MHIAIQGDRASFHELAANQYYSSPVTYLYCRTFADAFEALRGGQVDRAFLAVSNSSHGPIGEVQHLLALHQLVIEETYRFAVHQHLIGTSDATLADIETVTSHPVALSQCSVYLERYESVLPHYDTAAAIEEVQRAGDKSVAAVGSQAAAELYGLKVLARNIHNDPDNHTVFASLRLAPVRSYEGDANSSLISDVIAVG